MVYARTRAGYLRFREVNRWIFAGMALIYMTMITPPVSRLIFNVLLGLPASVAAPANRPSCFRSP